MRLHTQHTRMCRIRGRVPHAGGGWGGAAAHQARAPGDGAVDEAGAGVEDSGLY